MVRASSQSLVVGVLAFQTNFVNRENLLKALQAWSPERDIALGEILVGQRVLSSDERQLLEALAERHLSRFNDNADQCLAALLSTSSAREVIEQWRTSTLDPHATLSFGDGQTSVGVSTSAGGRFQILRPHARGGLGEVLLALDTELNREVALKQMQPRGALHGHLRSRFVLEAEITGRLEHPGVVPVYGLGAYDDGRPYYVMRMIRGESLKEAIEKLHRNPALENLQLRQLLSRLMSVCDALAYAHSRGVLHRDIKPANIMLGPFGETLVVDWGLAKELRTADGGLRDEEATEARPQADATQVGQVIGTPAYMSPEQAAGRLDLLGPASDIYSLGATLYNLLTGRTPFAEPNPDLLLEQVQQGGFPSPRTLNPAIPRPLEAICLKAMSRQTQDRYASATDLKADLEHWLADEPVSAYPERLSERATRWTRKHRGATRAAGIALAAIAIISAAATLFVDRERRRADDNARQATQLGSVANYQRGLALKILNQLVFDLQTRLSDRPGMQNLREELLSQAVEGLEQVAETFDPNWQPPIRDPLDIEYERGYVEGFASTQRVSADQVKAVALAQMGDILRSAGRRKEAVRRYDQGHAIMVSLWRDNPEMRERMTPFLANSHQRRGLSHFGLDDLDAAHREFGEVLKLREALAAAEPGHALHLQNLAWTYEFVGDVLFQQGRMPAAYDRYRRALALFEQSGTSDPRAVGQVLHDLGSASLRMGNPALAREYYQRALTHRQNDHAASASVAKQAAVASSYLALGNSCLRLKDPQAAREYFLEALKLRESLQAADPLSLQAQRELRVALNRLGHVCTLSNELTAAREYLKRELELAKKLAALDADSLQAQTNLAAALAGMALLEGKAGNPLEAARLTAQGGAIYLQVRLSGKQTQEPLLPNWVEQIMQVVDPRRGALVSSSELPPNTPPEAAREVLLLRSTVLSSQGEHAAAVEAAEKLHAMSTNDAEALYDAARCFALAEQSDRALAVLQQAAAAGFGNWQRMQTDPDLRMLRDHGEYRKLINRLSSSKPTNR